MTLEVGEFVWIPCEVTRSAFSDERNVVVESPTGRWVGCVSIACLRDAVVDGPTAIRATIVESRGGEVRARLAGQTNPRQYLTVTTT